VLQIPPIELSRRDETHVRNSPHWRYRFRRELCAPTDCRSWAAQSSRSSINTAFAPHAQGMFDTQRQDWHERRLASDARAGRRARDEIRTLQWSFVKRSSAWLLSGVVLGAACTAAVLLVVHGSFARGMVVGAAIAFHSNPSTRAAFEMFEDPTYAVGV
jgi:hypothetical protein